MRQSRALAIVCLGLGIASEASAAAIPNGVEWIFRGTISSVSPSTAAWGTWPFWIGDPVSGRITMVYTDSGARSYSADISLPGGGAVAWSTTSPRVNDVPSGPADSLYIETWTTTGNLNLSMNPGFTVDDSIWASLSLYDSEGTAWNGINPRTGDIPPDYAPDASVFERPGLSFGFLIRGPSGASSINEGFSVKIDAFPVPEPGALALGSLAALALLRSGAPRARRGDRAVSR